MCDVYGDPRALHSFPTRRSSDLAVSKSRGRARKCFRRRRNPMARIVGMIATSHTPTIGFALDGKKQEDPVWKPIFERSEEHTSELQSLRHHVCRLLLEKQHLPGR